MQGEKEISLTGFLSCTIDSIEIGGRMEDGLEVGYGAKNGKKKADN